MKMLREMHDRHKKKQLELQANSKDANQKDLDKNKNNTIREGSPDYHSNSKIRSEN